jgi:Ca2+:H+ antiporter
VVVPFAALIALALTWGREIGSAPLVLAELLLAGAVLAAVQHAEVVAHRVGEPFGSLVLAIAVTVIEVALIITLMTSGGQTSATLARDTVFAAAMITMTGIAGLSLPIGSLRYGVTLFNAEGSGALLATVATLATLNLVLPTFTTSHPGPQFRPSQLISPHSRRPGSTWCSCSPRRCGTATSSCQSRRRAWSTTRPSTRRRRAPAPR